LIFLTENGKGLTVSVISPGYLSCLDSRHYQKRCKGTRYFVGCWGFIFGHTTQSNPVKANRHLGGIYCHTYGKKRWWSNYIPVDIHNGRECPSIDTGPY
jgi:hypothetical protein